MYFVWFQLLDLFTLSEDKKSGSEGSSGSSNSGKLSLENLPALWDQKQYEEEYNMDTFISTLK